MTLKPRKVQKCFQKYVFFYLQCIVNLKKSSNYNSHQIIQKAQITCNGGAINDDDI